MSNNKKFLKRKTFKLRLTKFELLHLRDLMSIVVPPDLTKTVSQVLADAETRSMVEAMLWKKLTNLCLDADIPMGDDAPDFVVAPTTAPPIGVFRMATDPNEQAQEHDDDEEGINLFSGNEEE